jgi:hypothetical protein
LVDIGQKSVKDCSHNCLPLQKQTEDEKVSLLFPDSPAADRLQIEH